KRARRKREDPDVRDEDNAQKRARQARKREDPDVRDKENAQQRARQAKKRENSQVRDKENAQKRARRAEDGEYRDALQVRDVNRKRTARNEKRDRRVDLSKGFVDEEHTTFALWRAMRKRRAMMKMTTRFMTKRRSQDHAIYASPRDPRDPRDQNDKTHLSRFTICFVRLSPCLALPGSSFFACLPCYASSSSRGALAGAKRRLVTMKARCIVLP
ncbi:hypothetical protein THAOC_28565, partial [Thalassiosira oceanica]